MNKQNSFSNKTIEALKMAIDDARIKLGYLRQYINEQEPVSESASDAVIEIWKTLDTCKEALAEAEKQEPVSCKVMAIDFDKEDGYTAFISLDKPIEVGTKLYTHPATWQSLSDDNILKLFKPKFECEIEDFELVDFARAIEQALKELNAKK